jgi:nucleoside-diphosphate-sugar epimerase
MTVTADQATASRSRVLVTGASGFLGRHVLPELTARGFEVHGVGHLRDVPDTPGVAWHRVDLFDSVATGALIREVEPTHLVHLAWCASPGEFWSSPANLAWLTATMTLLQQFIAGRGQRFLVAGSCAEYDWRYGYCVEDLTPLTPSTLYGTAKHATYLLARELAAQHAISWAWARLFFLYGPHEQQARLVPSVIRALSEEREIPCSHGTQLRDFLYVADAASALAAVLDSSVSGAVNVASGQPVAVRDVVAAIARRFGRPDLVNFGAIDSCEAPAVLASVSRLQEGVSWVPGYSLGEGLIATIRWWEHQSLTGSVMCDPCRASDSDSDPARSL